MYKNNSFSTFIEDTLKKSISSNDFKTSLQILCNSITSHYKNTKICFAKKFEKRLSFIVGEGKETFTSYEKIPLNKRYFVLFQNFSEVNFEEKEILIALFKVIIAIKTENN